MRCRFVPLLLALVAPAAGRADLPAAAAAGFAGVREHTLPNGLRVYLKPVPEMPVVCVMTAYRVGSADELLDQTGLSHYLEHLMFKGTDKFLPGDIDHLTRRAGGKNNAYTTVDFTNFHFEMPADRWHVALEIEADRMRNLRIDARHEFEQEKGAVIAELDQGEDEPWELENKAILPLLFGPNSPYGHPIIGEKAHVRAATAAVIKAHYDRWYHPNNASIVVVGGFDPDQALAKVTALFGPIPKAELPQRHAPKPVERAAPVRKTIPSKFDVDRLVVGFNTVQVGDPADYALDVIEHALTGGKTGRLYRRLVLEQEVAGEVSAKNLAGRYPGWFSIELEVMKGADPKEAEKALLAELTKLADEPLSEAELRRAKRGILASLVFSQEGVHDLADGIVNAVAVAGLDYRRTYPARLAAVTAADVQRVAKQYLAPQKRVVVLSSPPQADGHVRASGGRQPPEARRRAIARRQPPAESKPQGADAPRSPADLTKAKRAVLPNGLTLLLLENRRVPVVFAEAYVKRARLYEPAEKAGVAALVGGLLEEGTTDRSGEAVADAIADVGGVLTMSGTGGSVKVLAPDRAAGLGLLLECLTRPAFAPDAVQRLREHQLSEIEVAEQQPHLRAQDAFHERVFGDHPLGRPARGTEDTVPKLTPADCRAFHRKVFVPNNTVLVVVGDFDAAAVVAEVTALTKGWAKRDLPAPEVPAVALPEKFVQKVLPMESAAQVNVYFGHVGVRRTNPDYVKLLVMDHVLGVGSGFTDRLSAALRDRTGWAYQVRASITDSASEEPGVFAAFVGTYPDKFLDVKKQLRAELDRFLAAPPTAAEVGDAKEYVRSSLAFGLVTNADLAEHLLTAERFGLGLDYLERFRKEVAAVTPADVFAAAKKYLHPDKMALIAAGPIDHRGRPLKAEK